jgi:hypothetical protein
MRIGIDLAKTVFRFMVWMIMNIQCGRQLSDTT